MQPTKSVTISQFLALAAAAACGGPGGGQTLDEHGCSDASSSSDAAPEGPATRCLHQGPLAGGDANWSKAPFEPPGDMPDDTGGSESGGAGDSGGDDGGDVDTGGASFVGFIQDPDGGGVSIECDAWAMDCPRGEKCMPWANDGGSEWNATRCSPLDPDPAHPGDQC